MNRTKTKAAGKRGLVGCVECGKKFDGWRQLQQHKRKSCAKSSRRFFCRECRAFFLSKAELKSHIFGVHDGRVDSAKFWKNSRGNGTVGSANRSEESSAKDPKQLHGSKRKKLRTVKSDGLKKQKTSDSVQAELNPVTLEASTIGGNPFPFTTSCAPDAPLFQFLCLSCVTVRFPTYPELRRHEDWCARVRSSQGFVCHPCGRHYRNLGTLRRHADEYHHKAAAVSSGEVKVVGNPYRFSTACALDADGFPHACSSCESVCFRSSADLRLHEDWCGQCLSTAENGSKCGRCGRHFRTAALLERHGIAADCTKAGATVNGQSGGSGESGNVDADMVEKVLSTAAAHSVCPLCDVPFMSQHEQQVHFINVHNLTSSQPKKANSMQSGRGSGGTRVTCHDCDMSFSSRLELVQHKRVCTKEKLARVVPPAVSLASDFGREPRNGKNGRSAADGRSPDAVKNGLTADLPSGVGSGAGSLYGVKSEAGLPNGNSGLKISRGLLLNSTKVRDLVKCTGAKRLLLRPDGELLMVDSNSRKISTVGLSGVLKKVARKTRSGSIDRGTKPSCSSEACSTASELLVDRKLQSPSSDLPAKTTRSRFNSHRTDSASDLKSTAGNFEAASPGDNSDVTGARSRSSCSTDATMGDESNRRRLRKDDCCNISEVQIEPASDNLEKFYGSRKSTGKQSSDNKVTNTAGHSSN